jgi:hypothetical protein
MMMMTTLPAVAAKADVLFWVPPLDSCSVAPFSFLSEPILPFLISWEWKPEWKPEWKLLQLQL